MDSKQRCGWAGSNPLMQTYHDTEWGVPQRDPRMLWETLMLEGFQAGLSWEIILRKRDAFREAFAGFDPQQVARFDEHDIERLMANPGIVRARAKIMATVKGAQIFNAMQERGEDFAAYCWSFTAGEPIAGNLYDTQTPLSAAISKDLKARGFKFVGPTIVYAWMQAVGITNDHMAGCYRQREVFKAKR
ncbi:DNA-3-methyladenine glycosylase I [Novosphingobium guangzhouense]|uniref:3-methyladenine DNA glycosylase n=1 Tax=Novosphingobium guangzhouense TaxID=1850347 RepID=A0A2K2G3T9_9SPHN|nr:DNA-3-methyladenine glycosylase I [Novosphingobium guangzhouense]PNU05710.1 3-methyladenine DNA glycosylase [Novosphingobium guangzhouense]